MSQLEKHIMEMDFQKQQAIRDKQVAENILTRDKNKRDEFLKEKEALLELASEVKKEKEEFSNKYFEKKRVFEELEKKCSSTEEELKQKNSELLSLVGQKSQLEAQLNSIKDQHIEEEQRTQKTFSQLEDLQQQRSFLEDRKNKVFNQLEKEQQLRLDLSKDIKVFEQNINQIKKQLEQETLNAEKSKEQLTRVAGRLYGLEELQQNFEGFQSGVKNILLWQKQNNKNDFTPVAQVIEVDETYEIAMEAALSEKLQVLFTDKKSTAINALDYLKTNEKGRAGFIYENHFKKPMDSQTEKQIKNTPGVAGFLKDFVSVPSQYNSQIDFLIKDVVVVNSIEKAIELQKTHLQFTYVTLQGDSLSPDGLLTGGDTPTNLDGGILKRRREIKELSQTRQKWANELSLAEQKIKKTNKTLEALQKDSAQTQNHEKQKDILLAELKKDFEVVQNEETQLEKNINEQKNLFAKAQKLNENLSTKKADLIENLKQIKITNEQLTSHIENLNVKFKQHQVKLRNLQESWTELEVKKASRDEKEENLKLQTEKLDQNIQEWELRLSEMKERSQESLKFFSQNTEKIKNKKQELEQLITQTTKTHSEMSSLTDDFESIGEECRQLEEQILSFKRQKNEEQSQTNEVQLNLDQFQMKQNYIIEQNQDRYGVDLSVECEKYRDREAPSEDIKKEVKALKEKLNRMGGVNLAAIEEYEELKTRNEFLLNQYNDLIEAKEQLKKVIHRINRICTQRFSETFNQVNERFKKVFPVLFGGGEASLILVSEEDKEDGIDIMSCPPGKKLQNVSLLSGGEKALTAVSLLFSIFLVKPSPFCLLDEVDAPLDDVNVMRFNDLIKEMAHRSQIIVVTHNKHTMSVNNRLYGVTMEEKGVSKMVSVELDSHLAQDLAPQA